MESFQIENSQLRAERDNIYPLYLFTREKTGKKYILLIFASFRVVVMKFSAKYRLYNI